MNSTCNCGELTELKSIIGIAFAAIAGFLFCQISFGVLAYYAYIVIIILRRRDREKKKKIDHTETNVT